MKQTSISIFLVGALLVLTACSPSPQELEGSWTLVQLNGEPILPDVVVLLTIEEGAISGSSGCNTYSGGTILPGGKVELNELSMTLVACLDQAVNDQETNYFIALNRVDRWKISSDDLTLSGSGVTLQYERAVGGFFNEPNP